MPTMQDSVAVLANSVSTNQLAGQLYEFIETGTLVVLSTAGSATGLRDAHHRGTNRRRRCLDTC